MHDTSNLCCMHAVLCWSVASGVLILIVLAFDGRCLFCPRSSHLKFHEIAKSSFTTLIILSKAETGGGLAAAKATENYMKLHITDQVKCDFCFHKKRVTRIQ